MRPSSESRAAIALMSLHRALEVGDEVFGVHSRHDLHKFPTFGSEVVENLLCGVNEDGCRQVFPSSHEPDCIDSRGLTPRIGRLKV